MKRVMITVGGTGGHIFPAVALAESLNNIDCHFIGGNLIQNPYFKNYSYPCESVSCSTISLRTLPSALFKIIKGIIQSRAVIKQKRPDLIVGFGSYYTFPTLVAAILTRTPFILHEADSIPGKVNSIMSSHALVTAVHFPKMEFKGKTVEVEMPLRKDCRKGSVSRKEALAYFGLEDRPTLLIFGGSQGARALNRVFDLDPSFQVIHITGEPLPPLIWPNKSCVKAFEKQMNYALEVADFAICRSGASTIAELIEYEIPAIMVPFPRATKNHQEHNARYISDELKAGITLPERFLDDKMLAMKFKELVKDGAQFKDNLREYKQGIKRPNMATIVNDILEREL